MWFIIDNFIIDKYIQIIINLSKKIRFIFLSLD